MVLKNKAAQERYVGICKVANASIIENERVVDNQTILITLALVIDFFSLLFIPIKLITGPVLILMIVIILLSFISLLMCLLVPTYFIHKRRKIKDIIKKCRSEDKEYSSEDLGNLEYEELTKNMTTLFLSHLKIDLYEKIRLCSVFLTIFLLFIFIACLLYSRVNMSV